ncbi:MAG: hypothetical protein GY953_01000 [bacterium]|nr:hypothetical protein [bacterium]
MAKRLLGDITWFHSEPPITHSFAASLATAIHYLEGSVDPAWLMGASGFAFRTFVNSGMCPSAMSVFDWKAILPEAMEQTGRRCVYISRLWEEAEHEAERRRQAHQAISGAIERGVPAIVWDVADCEWGLVIGCDPDRNRYEALSHSGAATTLAFDKLGRNGVDILSVAIPGERNERGRDEVIRRSLEAAVAHAEQREPLDRPKYQDGLPALEMWASLVERWALILDTGHAAKLPEDLPRYADYYARHHYTARCHARDYLEPISNAADSYAAEVEHLKPVWEYFRETKEPASEPLREMAEHIRAAREAEEEGVERIRQFLS